MDSPTPRKYRKAKMWQHLTELLQYVETLEDDCESLEKQMEIMANRNQKLAENLERFVPGSAQVGDIDGSAINRTFQSSGSRRASDAGNSTGDGSQRPVGVRNTEEV